MSEGPYVHGYSPRESERLHDQADTLAELLHCDTRYAPGEHVLEAGCGVGAQTIHLAGNSPAARFTCIDINPLSLEQAARLAESRQLTNVQFRQASLFELPFDDANFDHVFVCFVLEHLADPLGALAELRRVLKPGGTLTVIEGDHGSAYFHPDSPHARAAIQTLIDLQATAGGDSLIGRRLYPLLRAAGFEQVHVRPREVYADASRPAWVEGFTRNTFTAMVAGVRNAAIDAGLLPAQRFDQGLADLERTAENNGTFCYTFFKAVAVR